MTSAGNGSRPGASQYLERSLSLSIAKGGEITSVKDTHSTTAEGVFQTREYTVTPTVDAARAASIAAASAWCQWDHGAAAERQAELARLKEMMSAWGQTNVTQTRSVSE